MGEMSRLGPLIGLVKHAIWADPPYFLYLLLLSITQISASSQLIYDPPHRLVGLILIFLENIL
jgi:hypothetical protein